jgi:hypothetical protein
VNVFIASVLSRIILSVVCTIVAPVSPERKCMNTVYYTAVTFYS